VVAKGKNSRWSMALNRAEVAWLCPHRRACLALASACTFRIGLGSIPGVSVIERGNRSEGSITGGDQEVGACIDESGMPHPRRRACSLVRDKEGTPISGSAK
jgi:hypothetical protein